MRINTNIASMTAQENAANVNKNLSSSLEKLSSGLRINKAADDASGMAIADKLRTQASSLGQSISNANSANALVQIADKAMAEQSNILDIVKTKLIQAATDTTSAEGREAIRKDVSKLLEQMDNIANQTNYNGINLLNTAGQELSFQVGEKAEYDIGLETAFAANTTGLGTEAIGQKDTITIQGATTSGANINNLIEGEKFEITINDQTLSYMVTNEDLLGDGSATPSQDSIKANVASSIADLINESALGVTATAIEGQIELVGDDNTTFTAEVKSLGIATASAGTTVDAETFVNGADAIKQVVELAAGANGNMSVTINGTTYNQTAEADLNTTFTSLRDQLVADGIDVAAYSAGDNKLTITAAEAGADNSYNIGATGLTLQTTTVGADAIAESASFEVTTFAEGDTLTVSSLPSGNTVAIVASDDLEESLTRLATAINKDAVDNDKEYTATVADDGKTLVITANTAGADTAAAIDDLAGVDFAGSATSQALVSEFSEGISSETTSDAVLGTTLEGLKNLNEGELTSAIANEFMEVVDTALNQINIIRSDFGSTQNQLDSFIRNAMTTQTNIKAAESVIRDVDYAQESANFNKQNIIAQAGTYAMSQANAVQQNVMRLLQ